jgi:hypothetical protein
MNVVMNVWVPENAGKLSNVYTTGGLSSSSFIIGTVGYMW